MKIIKTEDEIIDYVNNNLKIYYQNRLLIPFIGSGFTAGSKNKFNLVPDTNQVTVFMKDLVINFYPEIKNEIEQTNNFQTISQLFYSIVPKNDIKQFLKKHFTNVQLDDIKTSFINHDWDFIYTLNIDDAIENNSRLKPIISNKKIDKSNITNAVFKLHGDATYEISYLDEQPGIIFSRNQYLASLKSNVGLLNAFLEDYNRHNILFIGCSLDNEIDIEYILTTDKYKSNKTKSDKILITSSIPSKIKEMNLSTFGINIVLVVQDYSEFLKLLNKEFTSVLKNNTNSLDSFKTPKLEINKNKEYNLSILQGKFEPSRNSNEIEIPIFYFERDICSKIINQDDKQIFTFIVGKRVSGKSFLSYDLAKKIKNKTVYLFTSKISLNDNILESIEKLENSTLIFDTETIKNYTIENLLLNKYEFEKRNTNFIIFINGSDRLLLSLPYSKGIECKIYELDNFLTKDESHKINGSLSKFGLINFNDKHNILSNQFLYKDYYGNLNSEIDKIIQKLTVSQIIVYALSATFEKVYSTIYRSLGISYDELELIINKSNGAIEFEFNLSDFELNQHSSYKTVTNSKSYLFSILGSYIAKDFSKITQVSRIIKEIVRKLKPTESSEIYKGLISFDNLNQIFYKKNSNGSINLIFNIYEGLSEFLYDDKHYWMQRAKSIYYLKRTDRKSLLDAIDFTKKCYFDSHINSKTRVNASLQIAMIYCRIINLQKFDDLEILENTLEWFSIALKENTHNNKVIYNIIEDARKENTKNDFYNLCIYLFTLKSYNNDLNKNKDFILSKYNDFKYQEL